ncbi:DUF6308 family protein [Modestobacter sp. NPDC049651]|uniref:DUF6308 family protein n=1 Tax=unclassified Modestobacter TaxID=2643866 RepID=UPI003402C4A4
MCDITIAGQEVTNPFERLVTYALRYAATLRRYDLGGSGDPSTLSAEDVARTRVIASRISHRERDWFVARGRSAPWADVPLAADLGDADPALEGDLYDRLGALYEHFRVDAPRNVSMAKISKVLHLKRRALVPVLDSHLEQTYRIPARRAAVRYPARGYKRMYWAAIRDDLLANRDGITVLKARAAQDEREQVRLLAELSDLRVLDILTW